jgi:hypothetical protein
MTNSKQIQTSTCLPSVSKLMFVSHSFPVGFMSFDRFPNVSQWDFTGLYYIVTKWENPC